MEENTADVPERGDRARRLRPQPFLQEQLPCSVNGPTRQQLHYLDFAKGYVASCEEHYGRLAVEMGRSTPRMR